MKKELIVAGSALAFAYQIFQPALNVPLLIGLSLAGALIYVLNSNTIDKQVNQVFRNAGVGIRTEAGEHLYPELTHIHRTRYGFKMIYSVPPGLCDVDIWKAWRELEFATKSEIEIYEHNHLIHINAYTHDLPNMINMPKELEHPEGMILPVTFGKSRAGTESLCLVSAQHILVAGETGTGKTNLLRVIAVNLALQDNVKLFVIDVKRNLGFLRKHSWFACEYEEIFKLVSYLSQEMTRRYELFDRLGIDDIRDLPEDRKLPYLILIVDEFAGISPALVKSREERAERADVVFKIVDLLNRGRGAGMFVILGVQRPDAELMSSGQIKSNISVRFAFYTVDETNSRIIIDKPHAALLPADLRGRCYLRGRDRLRQVQIYNLPLKTAKSMLPKVPKTKPVINYGLKGGEC